VRSHVIVSTISMVIALLRYVVCLESTVVIRMFLDYYFYSSSAAVSRHNRTRVILSHFHCTVYTHNMSAATPNINSTSKWHHCYPAYSWTAARVKQDEDGVTCANLIVRACPSPHGALSLIKMKTLRSSIHIASCELSFTHLPPASVAR